MDDNTTRSGTVTWPDMPDTRPYRRPDVIPAPDSRQLPDQAGPSGGDDQPSDKANTAGTAEPKSY